MTPALSPNTQAILLLTAPLIIGRGMPTPDLLSPGEYKRLARHLREMQRQPADLMSPLAAELLHACQSVIDESRLQRLLGRGFLLSQVIEHWQARAIWVVSRADSEYPRRLKARLREDAPALLYGCGELSLLETGGLAVVGSRHVDDTLVDYTMEVGRLAARSRKTIVSGGARGIDQAAMRGALEAGGNVSGVLADSLEKAAMNRDHRNLIIEGQLVLISPYDPNAGFNVGHAMQRNKLIYALSDSALVVSSDFNKGGTWAGAVEQLDKLHLVNVYVRSTGEISDGLKGLSKKGAIPWPNPKDTEAFDLVFNVPKLSTSEPMDGLSLFSDESMLALISKNIPLIEATQEDKITTPSRSESSTSTEVVKVKPSPADTLFLSVSQIIQSLLQTPMKDVEVAVALDVSNSQAKIWLQRLVDAGVLDKQKKPAGYIIKQSLF